MEECYLQNLDDEPPRNSYLYPNTKALLGMGLGALVKILYIAEEQL